MLFPVDSSIVYFGERINIISKKFSLPNNLFGDCKVIVESAQQVQGFNFVMTWGEIVEK